MYKGQQLTAAQTLRIKGLFHFYIFVLIKRVYFCIPFLYSSIPLCLCKSAHVCVKVCIVLAHAVTLGGVLILVITVNRKYSAIV